MTEDKMTHLVFSHVNNGTRFGSTKFSKDISLGYEDSGYYVGMKGYGYGFTRDLCIFFISSSA
jgi:hypothetical protein